MFDVIVIGAGPAGLNATLILGRCRRKVLVCDTGEPRNKSSQAVHGFISREGMAPLRLRELARKELAAFDNVEFRIALATEVSVQDQMFEVVFADGTTERARKLLLATGIKDELPDIPGFEELYGTSVFHCPYCDGWEWRDRAIAVYGTGEKGAGYAMYLSNWSRNLNLFTHGKAQMSAETRRLLEVLGIEVFEDPIESLEADGKHLKAVLLSCGRRVERDALFFTAGWQQHSDFALTLGCERSDSGEVSCQSDGSTIIPGLFVAGDCSHSVNLVVVAAGRGAQAACAINVELHNEALSKLTELQKAI